MTAHCKTCGQALPASAPDYEAEARVLLGKLKDPTPRRMVYRAKSGAWRMTDERREVSAPAVGLLLGRGLIRSVYSNAPNDAYHVGKTLDYERTMEARKTIGRGAPNYFVGDP